MKKIYYALVLFILLIVGFYSFVSSTYFFNRYIAKNIKEYGFNYVKVNGALFKGFVIEELSYKDKELSSNVELEINPFKLISGIISINKLQLISVRKNVLEEIVNDFKPKDDTTTTSNKIDLNFELNNILLTLKPFTIDNIRVKKAALSVDKIEYIDYKFNVGNLEYESKSDIANLYFKGQFKKRVLTIDNIDVFNLDSNRFIKLLNSLKSKDSKNSSEFLNSPFTPKLVNIKEATLNLKPVNYKDLSLKDLEVKINRAKFNVEKVKLEEAELKFKYSGKELDLNLYSSYKNSNLTIFDILVNIKEANKLEKVVKSMIIKDSNSSSSGSLFALNRVNILKGIVTLNNYKFKDNIIKDLYIDLDNTSYNLDTKILKSNYFNIRLDSTLTKITTNGAIDKEVIFNNINILANNIDKIIKYIPTNSDSNSSKTSPIILPKYYRIDNLSIKGNQATFGKFVINKGRVSAKNLKGKLEKFSIDKGSIKAFVNTPWGVANLDGNVSSNNYYAKGSYKVEQRVLDEFNLPLKAKNFKKLLVNGRFGFDSLDINISLKGKDILKGVEGLTINSSKNRFFYNYNNSNLKWDINANIIEPYIIGEAKLSNTLIYKDRKLNYSGKVVPKNSIFSNKELNKLSQDLIINYKGDSSGLNANFKSNLLNVIFTTNYKVASINIKGNKKIVLSNIIDLPNSYKNSVISKLNITGDLDFNNLSIFSGNILLNSNLINIVGKWKYNNIFSSTFNTQLPKSSLIFKNIKNLNYNALKSFDSKLEANNKYLNLELKNSNLYSKLNYNFSTTKVNSKIGNKAIDISITGIKDNLDAKVAIPSIKKALNSIYKIYKVSSKVDTLDGKLESSFKIENLSRVYFEFLSPKIVNKTNSSSTKVENIYLKGKYSDNNIVVNRYRFKVNDYKIFSNKNSIIKIDKNSLNIKEVWINDSLAVVGSYNLDLAKGKVKLKSNRFELDSKEAKVALAVDTTIKIIKDKKDIAGTINILEGKIKSTITRKNIADNEDIVILQRKKAKESTDFAKNIKLNIKVKSKSGLIYSQAGSYFKLLPNMSVKKSYNRLSDFRGTIKVAKGSYYTLNGKKLKVTKGLITFKGKSTSPNLNIELVYRGKEYNVYVNISGTPTRPILYFRSNPPLTKDQILAYLLFDDSSAIGTHSQEAMLNMIGGSLAKSLLGSIGIKIDHISVKENGFSIGKNITKNITVYYNQDKEKPSIKTRIDITNSVHTEIELGKDKQSADIIFTREY